MPSALLLLLVLCSPASAEFAPYSEDAFRFQVDNALADVRRVLDSTRAPVYANEAEHSHADLYDLAEATASTTVAAALNVLEQVGLDQDKLMQARAWAGAGQSVTILLRGVTACSFSKEVTRQVRSATEHVKTTASWTGTTESREVDVYTVTEYHWRLEASYQTRIYAGADSSAPGSFLTLQQGEGQAPLVTRTKHLPSWSPFPAREHEVRAELTGLLRLLEPSLQARFTIDREDAACRTPSRNPQVAGLLEQARQLFTFFDAVKVYYNIQRPTIISNDQVSGPFSTYQEIWGSRDDRLFVRARQLSEQVFVPVLPLFAPGTTPTLAPVAANASNTTPALAGLGEASNGGAGQTASPMLRPGELTALLAEQRRSLAEAMAKVDADAHDGASGAEGGSALLGAAEAKLFLAAHHLCDVLRHYFSAVSALEALLRKQLVAAVGRSISAADFARFMAAHEARAYRPEYAPAPFAFAVRRPGHAPEGSIAIEDAPGIAT